MLIAATLLIGFWGWIRHRQRIAAESARSWLFEADRLAIEASDKSDLTKWGEAVAAARQARGSLIPAVLIPISAAGSTPRLRHFSRRSGTVKC